MESLSRSLRAGVIFPQVKWRDGKVEDSVVGRQTWEDWGGPRTPSWGGRRRGVAESRIWLELI